jgi:diacylglycerol kinase (ATP)
LPVYTEGNHLDEEHLEKLSPIMVYRRAKSIRVTAPRGFAYTLDGEIVEENEFVMEVVPAALRFAVPHQPVPADQETPAEESASV